MADDAVDAMAGEDGGSERKDALIRRKSFFFLFYC
jgi:hypothetical protein